MTLFCRRLRLEIDLTRREIVEPSLPPGYRWMGWTPALIERHAAVKLRCFQGEQDGQIFPSLRTAEGCRRLMEYITQSPQFLPSTTWLLTCNDTDDRPESDCGTIQGMATSMDSGAIQNVGIAPNHRGRGLGRALLLASLRGFQASGVSHVSLEVTAANQPALRLYESLGFQRTKTLYRSINDPT
jgi:ribosomal protein S18 acetylase RimI-like enzyme